MKTAPSVFLILMLMPAALASEPPALPDLSGTWASRQITTSVANVPVVGDIETRATATQLLEITQNGPNLVINEKVCSIRLDPEYDQVRPVLPKALLNVMGTRKRVGLLTRSENGSVNFRQQTALDVLGAKLKDPWKDTLPTSLKDPRLVDQDNDGKPGVTIKTEGLIEADIYFAQRNWTSLTGIVSGETVSGQVMWRSQQNILDATSIFLTSSPGAKAHKSPKKNHFRMRKINAGASCGDIILHQKKWFGK